MGLGATAAKTQKYILALDIRHFKDILENILALSMKDEDFSGTTRG